MIKVNGKDRNGKKRAPLALLPGAYVYLALLLGSVLFTQFLRSSLSTAFLMFMIILPFVSLLYTFIGRSSVQVYVTCDTVRTEKNTPVKYEMRIINSSFLPYSFLEADVSEPGDEGFRCFEKRLVFSLVPFGSCTVANSVVFKYRGYYEIGVDCIYISDPLRMFSLKHSCANYAPVTVMPRKMTVSERESAFVTDSPSSSNTLNSLRDRTEISDIRDYFPGDPVKNIHWKLSSKADDIKLKEYTAIEDRHVYVFCDLARHTSPPEKNAALVYENLKKMLSADRNKKALKLRSSIQKAKERSEENPSGETVDSAQPENSARKKRKDAARKKKIGAKYEKNIKSGMSKEQADTIKMIDELISSTTKKKSSYESRQRKEEAARAKEAKANEKMAEDMESLSELENESDLEKIISAARSREKERDPDERAHGGRVSAEFEKDHDEFCADAVVEIAIAAALDEIKKGNICTLVWFDPRESSGIAAYTVSSENEFDTVYMKLSTASPVDKDARAAALSIAVEDSSNVTVKVVTSNIDPVSVSELARIPMSFGGAGTGCSTEIYIYSPSERYERPLERRAYAAGVSAELLRDGIFSSELTEGTDRMGLPVFVTV